MMHYIKVSGHLSAFTAIILEWLIYFEYFFLLSHYSTIFQHFLKTFSEGIKDVLSNKNFHSLCFVIQYEIIVEHH